MYLGVQVEPQFGYTLKQIKDIVTFAEANGFSHAWFSDHFMLDANATNRTCIETILAMTAAASFTTSLRIGSLVLCNSYRYPAVLAKQLASLDHFSNGRLEFGYGAGWKKLEYEAYGIPFPPMDVRIRMLAEGIQVIKLLWSEEKPSFQGQHYQLKEAISNPKPLQQPRPTIWIGTTTGKPKMLRLIAEHGDGINLSWAFPPSEVEEKISLLEEMMSEFGRDISDLKKSCGLWTRVYQDEEEKKKAWKSIAEKNKLSFEEVERRMTRALHGTPDEIISSLREYKKIGVTHFIFMFPHGQEKEHIEIFSKKIISKL